MMYIFIFEGSNAGIDTMIVIAHNEDEARDLINDYDDAYDHNADDYTLIKRKPLNKGIVAHILE